MFDQALITIEWKFDLDWKLIIEFISTMAIGILPLYNDIVVRMNL